MNVAAVPESVTRRQVCELLDALGIDARDVPRGATMTFGGSAISIEVFARKADGRHYAGPSGEEVAMHLICIPIVEDER
jgi:hypothetical protein